MNYYHCLFGGEIPLIRVKRDRIDISCKIHGKYKISMENFCDQCVKKCSECKINFPYYKYEGKYYCSFCMSQLRVFNSHNYNILKQFFSCKSHSSYYYQFFCETCKENKCKICKKKDNQNHHYIPNKSSNEENAILRNFIKSMKNKIDEIEEILKKMKLILNVYSSLLYDQNYIVNKEIIDNFHNLDIIKDIQNIEYREKFFIQKMDFVIKELEYIKYLEFNEVNTDLEKNIVSNDVKETSQKLPKNNNKVKLKMTESININANRNMNNNIINNDINDINNIGGNNIYIHIKNVKNKQKIYKINKDDSNKNNYNKMGINGCWGNCGAKNDNYLNNNKDEINFIKNNNISEEIKKKNDLEKLFQTPKNKLYQNYAIKLDDIENNSLYIINKVIKISQSIEDEINDDERNNFLLSVGNIARVAHNFSNELSEILIKKFINEGNEFSSIIYEKAKIELSSWANQALTIDESNKDLKYLRYFYGYHTHKEKSRIINYIKLDETVNSILNENNYDFYNLFRDLSQLYTEALIYSEKDIVLKYVEQCEFDYNKMTDATELSGRRYVKYTILPGLFVCKYNINNGKILVFCEKKLEKDYNNPFSDNIPINKELFLPKTIKSNEIREKISCTIQYTLSQNLYKIAIKTNPNITKNDYPKYSILIEDTKNLKKISSEKSIFYLMQKDVLNKNIYGTIELNGEKIKSNKAYIN